MNWQTLITFIVTLNKKNDVRITNVKNKKRTILN